MNMFFIKSEKIFIFFVFFFCLFYFFKYYYLICVFEINLCYFLFYREYFYKNKIEDCF